jgi:hypothetical protein
MLRLALDVLGETGAQPPRSLARYHGRRAKRSYATMNLKAITLGMMLNFRLATALGSASGNTSSAQESRDNGSWPRISIR